jgi:hypothetical protein
MKTLLSLCLTVSLLSGCALWPAKVGYFQKKVKPVPELPAKAVNHQRQAGQYVAEKTAIVEKAAIAEKSSPAVLVPAAEAAGAAAALTESLGPPASPFVGPSTNLIQTLHKDQATLNTKLDQYRDIVEPLLGKKIAGTGIQIGFFTNWFLWIGGGLLLAFLVWAGVKAYGMMNPAVSLGSNLVSGVAGKALSASVSEIVGGGERFLTYIENSPLTTDVKKWISELFKGSQQQTQSPTTSTLVDKLTASSPTTAPKGAPVTTPPASISTAVETVTMAVPATSVTPAPSATPAGTVPLTILVTPVFSLAPAPLAAPTASPAAAQLASTTPAVSATSAAFGALKTQVPASLRIVAKPA